MGFRPEPVLDVARGLSAFTAAYVLGNQVLVAMRELFTDRCEHCKGAGRVICQHCGGTKTLRSRPGEYQRTQSDIVDHRARDLYQCIHCGPMTVYDLFDEVEDDEDEAFDIMDNMKDAYAGRPRTHRMPILAGTVPCPMCKNRPKVRRHTPNFARVFKLEDPWWWRISCEAGLFRGETPIRRQEYVEYPSRKPHALDLDPQYLIQNMKAEYDQNVKDYEEAQQSASEWEEDDMAEGIGPPVKPAEEGGPENIDDGGMDPSEFVVKYVDDSDSEDDGDSDE